MKSKITTSQSQSQFTFATLLCLLCLCFLNAVTYAAPIKKGTAEKAVRGWIGQNKKPMGAALGTADSEAIPLVDEKGNTLCYIVNLTPAGFVIVSADDAIEPVIAFSASGYYEGTDQSALTAMLKKDMPERLKAAKLKNNKSRSQKKTAKWDSLLKADENSSQISFAQASTISDVRVDPFLGIEWDQSNVSGTPCYNYYTPNNYVTGCVGTAMAQVLRYYSWPTTGIGVHAYTIKVDGVSQTAYTRGGDSSGGAYNWVQMPAIPLSGVTTTQRQAIGALCYDASVSVGMSFTSNASSASLVSADEEFVDTFMYSDSVYTQSFSSSGDSRLWDTMNSNLDAQMPVVLGISGGVGGHAVIADGYGYNSGTLYHHINLGWGGHDNAWYQLPLIDASYTFNVMDDCIYNIYKSGTGEIISGRITNLAGAPLANVAVKAYTGSTLRNQTITNSRGVYALKNLSSSTTYRISATQSGENFLDQNVYVGNSNDWGTTGNKWGINFVSANVGPPTAMDIDIQDVNSLGPISITLQALDDGDPDPNFMHYIITSLPSHGVLSEPNVGPVDAVPYVMTVTARNIEYTPCPYFGGQDSFTYKANDGGTYPTGGDSNIATVSVNVSNQMNTNFATESSSYTTLMMNTGSFYDVRSEVIYLQGDIGEAQAITDLALNIYIAPGRTLNNWTIRMQHTNWSVFNNVTSQFLTSDWTTVYQSNDSIQTGWVNFHFDTPFEYNGVQNLLVDFSFNNSGRTSPAGGYFMQNVGVNRVLSLASSSGTHGDPLSWDFWALGGSYYLGSFVPSMKLIGEVPIDPLVGDFDATCSVRIPDLAIFSQAWMAQQANPDYNVDCDLTAGKGQVNIQDLLLLVDQWLENYNY